MHTIHASNINRAWPQAKQYLLEHHVLRPSRYGFVMEADSPVTTVYYRPLERVLFDPIRDANPFFHYFEFLWLISGRNDVEWLCQFLPRMKEFSNDGETFAGAYGYRWRNWFEDSATAETDQLVKIIRMLRKDHNDRRAVLQMWDPKSDLENPGCKDLPCNTNAYPYIRPYPDGDRLDLTVCCRSNDVCLGAYGANICQFSFLLEYLAGMIGVPVGIYRQVSNSWHAYSSNWEKLTGLPFPSESSPSANLLPNPPEAASRVLAMPSDPYSEGLVSPYPLVSDPETWDEDLYEFMRYTEGSIGWVPKFRNDFFSQVAMPLWLTWSHWKAGTVAIAQSRLCDCMASDWKLACQQWIDRRLDARARSKRQQSD